MSKNIQNLVLLMEPSENGHQISFKGGKMCFNRFSIDEDAAFELSGVHYLEKTIDPKLEETTDTKTTDTETIYSAVVFESDDEFKDKRKSKGKRYFTKNGIDVFDRLYLFNNFESP